MRDASIRSRCAYCSVAPTASAAQASRLFMQSTRLILRSSSLSTWWSGQASPLAEAKGRYNIVSDPLPILTTDKIFRALTSIIAPIRNLATMLGLPVHERDTFTGWTMPAHTNLIIAVSFGLFVPPRLLAQAAYGGLNLHPSLLPDLRGPAPLHHALLARRAATGVTLQTLDPRAFDHGVVLAQTPLEDLVPLGITAAGGSDSISTTKRQPTEHPYDDETAPTTTAVAQPWTEPRLSAHLAPLAADMLILGLRDGVHVPPHEDVGWHARLLLEEQQQRRDNEADRHRPATTNTNTHPAKVSVPAPPPGLRERFPVIIKQMEEDPRHAPKIRKESRQAFLPHLASTPALREPGEREGTPSLGDFPQGDGGAIATTAASASTDEQGGGVAGKAHELLDIHDLELRHRVIGPLWFQARQRRDGKLKRVILDGEVSIVSDIHGIQVSEAMRMQEGEGKKNGNDYAKDNDDDNGKLRGQGSRARVSAVRFTAHGIVPGPATATVEFEREVHGFFTDLDDALYIVEGPDALQADRGADSDGRMNEDMQRNGDTLVTVTRAIRIEKLKVEGDTGKAAKHTFRTLDIQHHLA